MRSNGESLVFLHRDLDQYFRFKMFKTCEIRSFSYVFPESWNYDKFQQHTITHLQSKGNPFFLHDLDIYFQFQMFKICEIRLFSYIAGEQKYEKIQQFTANHLRSIGVSPVYHLRYPDLYCPFQIFKICEKRSFSDISNYEKFLKYTFTLLRSTGVNTILFLRYLDLHFQSKTFNILISCKR